MPKNRIIPLAGIAALIPLVVWGQAPPVPPPPPGGQPAVNPPAAPPPEEPPTEAEKLLDAAVKKVDALESVSADIREHLEMLGQELELEGRYLKAPRNRVSFTIATAGLKDTSGKMVQVSDGETLWDFQQVLQGQTLRKLKIGPVLEKLKAPEIPAELRDQIVSQLGLAGPSTLLTGLRKSIHFDQKEAGTVEGRKVWVLRGNWKDRTGLVGPDQQALPLAGPLPAYIPSLAAVWIGQDDGWPYQVILTGTAPSILLDNRPRDANNRPIGARSPYPDVKITRIKLSYTNVKLNPALQPKDFAFNIPAKVEPQDDTEELLQKLDQATKAIAAQKKAEAARKEPLLDQPIDVPKADGAPSAAKPSSPSPTPATPAPLQPPSAPPPR